MKININDYTNSISVEDMTPGQFGKMLNAVNALISEEEENEKDDDF